MIYDYTEPKTPKSSSEEEEMESLIAIKLRLSSFSQTEKPELDPSFYLTPKK